MTQLKTAQDFIEFFEKIPTELWNDDGYFVSPDNNKCKCALGHLGVDYKNSLDSDYDLTPEAENLQNILKGRTPCINDGFGTHRDLGSTPKERIINALKQVRDQNQ